jgi:hypothetical protein
MKEARDAGNYFRLDEVIPRDAHGRTHGRSFDHPAAETIEDALECIRLSIKHGYRDPVAPGTKLDVYRHLPQSRIGGEVLEYVDTVTFGG